MSLSTVRAALKTKLDAVTGVENVYDYVYWTGDWETIYANFAKDGRINTWMIGLANIPNTKIDNGNRYKTYVFNLFVYYSLQTSTESSKDLEDLIDTVVNEFIDGFSFLVATTTENVVCLGIENMTYAGTPAHRAQLQITVQEITAQDLC